MSTAAFAEMESQLAALSREEQRRLLHTLARQIQTPAPECEAADELAAMANDPDIRRELQAIEREFAAAESDGLAPT